MKCFIPYSSDCEFPIENLPYGVFSTPNHEKKRIGVAIADQILDLSVISHLFVGPILKNHQHVFKEENLNAFMSLSCDAWKEARETLQRLLSIDNDILRNDRELISKAFVAQNIAQMHMPAQIGDYTDFSCSLQHGINVMSIITGRPKSPDLMKNARYLPLGYHSRASSVIVSGTPLHRPYGQYLDKTGSPVCQPTAKMDIELEMAAFVGGNLPKLGERINVNEAHKYIFGFVLMNDWSARDILQFEFQPLGPFIGKNSGTHISPWIVTPFALEPFKVPNNEQTPKPLSYLTHTDSYNFDIHLNVEIIPEQSKIPTKIIQTNLKYLYWTFKQQLAHHTIAGCNMKAGDLIGGGTISGNEDNSVGSLMELSYDGKKPFKLQDGTTRDYVNDNDTVKITGHCISKDFTIGFGVCEAKLLPALKI